MNSTTSRTNFPNEWDKNNEGAKELYDMCYEYVENPKDLEDMSGTSPFFIIFGFVIFIYIITVNIWLLCYYKSYIFNRQCVKYYLCMIFGTLVLFIDAYILEIYYGSYPCFVHHFFTSIGYPTYFFSIGFIIIKYYKYYYKSQIAYFNSFLKYSEDNQNNIMEKKFIFKKLYTNINSKQVLNTLVIINIFSIIYSIIIYFVDPWIKEYGFCSLKTAYLPQVLEFVVFMFLFLPLALIEALKFDDKFKMKKIIILLVILNIIYGFGFFSGSQLNKFNCSKLIQYIPPGFFVILSCFTSTNLLSETMLKDIIHLNNRNKILKATYEGMIEMLKDKVLFREFGEFCRNENCVENIIFVQEYWRYKKLFNKNEKICDQSDISSIILRNNEQSILKSNRESLTTKSSRELSVSKTFADTSTRKCSSELSGSFNKNESTPVQVLRRESTISKSSFDLKTNLMTRLTRTNSIAGASSVISSIFLNDKNESKTYLSVIKKQAKDFYESFIGINAIYEINIQNCITKKIKEKLIILSDDENYDMTTEEKIESYSFLFDKAYEEVTNNMYFNSYSNYCHQKLKTKNKKIINK
ncbi:hypothetical protein BCR36DRAFT_360904 [Piromyces finnis]|uniref:RGS domain-containing protein n=1 Tax=Piromyces finnis TaxID=1754191 RepID=A0A1Y1UZ32_9FUNG|nr:hypothetical protein BCR36DRAFT_360904 [Piromyces finnis]|eukprot:ORX43668.1 hypothetical protein BCR36DRAFT_360904 [Piromyces finnis]